MSWPLGWNCTACTTASLGLAPLASLSLLSSKMPGVNNPPLPAAPPALLKRTLEPERRSRSTVSSSGSCCSSITAAPPAALAFCCCCWRLLVAQLVLECRAQCCLRSAAAYSDPLISVWLLDCRSFRRRGAAATCTLMSASAGSSHTGALLRFLPVQCNRLAARQLSLQDTSAL